jgi:hypothetical protein
VHGVDVLPEDLASLGPIVNEVRVEPGTQNSTHHKPGGAIREELCYKILTTASLCSYSTPVHSPIRVLVFVNIFCLSVNPRLIRYWIMDPWSR